MWLLGVEISTTQQYGIATLLCFPMFFFAGAGSVVFWVIGLFPHLFILQTGKRDIFSGVSFFLIGLHASLHKSSEEGSDVETPFIEEV